MKICKDFSIWMDKHLAANLPENITAYNFNLYEGSDQTYEMELVGCSSFDEEDMDWACDEVFSTRQDLFCVPRIKNIENWEAGLSYMTLLVEKYLDEGKYAGKLKAVRGVGIGFVDGDIDILYQLE